MTDWRTFAWLGGFQPSDDEVEVAKKYLTSNLATFRDDSKHRETLDAIWAGMPEIKNDREKNILDRGYQIGYLMAMEERELWWLMRQAEYRRKAVPARKSNAERHHKVLARQYCVLTREMSDLTARKQLRDKHGHDLSYITKILKKQNAL